MNVKPDACRGCALYSLGQGFALSDGEGTSGVLVVAEALGEDEARLSRPLVGRAGQTWDRMVSRTTDPVLGKLNRNHFRHANVVSCRPPDNHLVKAPYESAAIDHCGTHLERVIREFKPRAILTLGNVPLRRFTSHWGIEQLRGYIFDTPWGPVVPTYHPSYIQRGKWNLARIVQLDILKVLEVARRGKDAYAHEKAYTLSPNLGQVVGFLEAWRQAGRPPLAFDIETPYSDDASSAEDDLTFEDDASYTILMVSLAYEPYKAISIPWIEPFAQLVREALREDAMYLVWNAKFDVPRLMANGVHFGGEVVDVMLAWHWLEPALPMGLKWVATITCPDMAAWKLAMHQNFQWYNAADSDVLLRTFGEVKKQLGEQGRWETFLRHFVKYNKVLMKLTERGVAVDHAKRAEGRDYFQGRFDGVVAEARKLAPSAILPVHPKRGYVKTPKDTAGMVQILVELTPEEELRLQKRKEREDAKRRKEAEKVEKRLEKDRLRQEKQAAKLAKAAERARTKVARGRGKRECVLQTLQGKT